MGWIISECHKCLGDTAEQQIIHDLLIHKYQGVEL
jgi:hypothetical protein